METYDIAVIPGDGIGKETVPVGQRVLEALAEVHDGFKFNWQVFPWGCEYYLKTGEMMPKDGIQTLAQFEHIFLGAVGFPGVPDHLSLWGLLIPIRREFNQYINLRPVKILRGLESPLKNDAEIDFVIVRENTEGEYSKAGGTINEGATNETVLQIATFSRMGVERVIRFAFDMAKKSKRKRLAAATKSNGIIHTMPYWDNIFENTAQDFPEIETSITHVDALAAFLVLNPEQYDVIVASNLFGDILSDIGGAVMGSIGIAPSANLNPEGKYPSLFEPVHGSAPDIAGRGVANPLGQMWTASMMLEHLGYAEMATQLLTVMQDVLELGIKTPDLGGNCSTQEVERELISRIKKLK